VSHGSQECVLRADDQIFHLKYSFCGPFFHVVDSAYKIVTEVKTVIECLRKCFQNVLVFVSSSRLLFNPLNAELIPICHVLSLLGDHPILRVSRIRVNVGWMAGFNFTVSQLHCIIYQNTII